MFSFNLVRWLRSLGRRSRARTYQKKPGVRLNLEELENRLAPALIWTGAGLNTNWDNPANWTRTSPTVNVIPIVGAPQDLVFNNTASVFTTNNNIAGLTISQLTVGSGVSYAFQGLGFNLASGAAIITINTNSTATLANPIQLGGVSNSTATFNLQSGAQMTLNGALSGTAATNLVVKGPGKLTLSQDNSGFAGPFKIDVTTGNTNVEITNAKALGTNTVTVTTATQLQLNIAGGGIIANALDINGSGSGATPGALLNVAGNNTWAGNIHMNAAAAVNQTTFGALGNTTLTVTGQISNASTSGYLLIKKGTGTLFLNPQFAAGNLYNADTRIDDGVISIGHPLALGVLGKTTTVSVPGSFSSSEIGAFYINYTGNPFVPAQYLNYAQVQTLTFAGAIAGSTTFRLNYNGAETADIPYSGGAIDATNIATALTGLSTIGGIGASVSVVDVGGTFNITFQGSLGGMQIPTLSATITSLPGTGIASIGTTSGTTPLGFRVPDVNLFLNGTGRGLGTMYNAAGVNTWDKLVTYTGTTNIGANANTNLTFAGGLTAPGTTTLNKIGQGRVILPTANTFTAAVNVAQGALNVRDSNALGLGTTLQKFVSTNASLELQADGIPDSDGRAGLYNLYFPSNITFIINGNGWPAGNGSGAIVNMAGVNKIEGFIDLRTSSAIGVAPDPDPYNIQLATWNNLSQLTVTGVIFGLSSSLTKVGYGELVLTNKNTYFFGFGQNSYQTFINQGWITIRHNEALGGKYANTNPVDQPGVFVAAGASLMIKEDPAGNNLTVAYNMSLAGTGITHRFPWLSQMGALVNLSGVNVATGDIYLNGATGVGVEFDGANSPVHPSKLTLTGTIYNGATAGQLLKLGSRRLVLQGEGLYTGGVDIRSGVLRIQHDRALGVPALANGVTTTTVQSGTGLELSQTPPLANGGIQRGLQVWNTNLILNGSGNVSFGDAPLTVFSDDHAWRGPITLNSVVALSFKNQLGNTALPRVVVDTTSLTGGSTSVQITTPGGAGANSVQTVTFTGAITGGTFRLFVDDGQGTIVPTAPIIWTTSVPTLLADIQAALDAIAGNFGASSFADVALAAPILDVFPNSRFLALGAVGDGIFPADISITGGGELVLGGVNTYRGTTYINQGNLTISNSRALGSSSTAEIQTLELNNPGTTFTLSFKGHVTPTLTYNANGSDLTNIAAALNDLPSIKDVGGIANLTQSANVVTVTLNGALAGFDQPALVSSSPNIVVQTRANATGGTRVLAGSQLQLQGGINVTTEALLLEGQGNPLQSEVQRVNVIGGVSATFRLSFTNPVTSLTSTTPDLPTGASAAQVRAALNQLTSIQQGIGAGGGYVDVAEVGESLYTVIFPGVFAGIDQPNIVASASQQKLAVSGAQGTFKLNFTGDPTVSVDLPFDVPATGGSLPTDSLQNALNALLAASAIGGGAGTATVTVDASGNFFVNFGGSLANALPPLLVATPSTNAGDDVAVAINWTATGFTFQTVQGGSLSAVPAQWFSMGSSTVTNADPNLNPATPKTNITGPISGVVADPSDGNILYVSTPGGGVWKTTNGGVSWTPLFDQQSTIQTFEITGADPLTDTYRLTYTDPITLVNYTTSPLPYNATAEQIKAALDAIVGAGNAVFTSQIINTTGVNEVQELRFDTATTTWQAGVTQFRLGWTTAGNVTWSNNNANNATGTNSNTAYVTYTGNDATDALNIQTALNNLPNIIGADPNNPGFVSVASPSPGVFQITFQGRLSNQNVSQIRFEIGRRTNQTGGFSNSNPPNTNLFWKNAAGGGISPSPFPTINGAIPTHVGSSSGTDGSSGENRLNRVTGAIAELTPGRGPSITNTIAFAGGALAGLDVAPLGVTLTGATSVTGAVASVQLDAPNFGGSGYRSTPTVTIAGGGGSGATARAVISGVVDNITMTNVGSGYSTTANPPISVTFFGGGATTQATGTAIIDDTTGTVTGINLVSPGSGYTSAPIIVISGGGGTLAAATATIDASVTGVFLINAGSGYTSAPTVTIGAPTKPGGVNATATATIATQVLQQGVNANIAMFGGSLAIQPGNNNVLYFATGDGNNSFDTYYGTGLYRSVDGGKTWTLMVDPTLANTNPLYGLAVNSIAFDPSNSSIVYLATSDLAANGLTGTGNQNRPTQRNPGIWRFNATENSYFNLTNLVSTDRQFTKSTQPHPPTAGAVEYNDPPQTPGPDDNYLLVFRQDSVSWTDVKLTNNGNNGGVMMYAALGTAGGSPPPPGTSFYAGNNNAVYHLLNPATVSETNRPKWYVGEPGSPNTVVVDNRSPSVVLNQNTTDHNEFPLGNGKIQIAALTGGGAANANSFNTIANDRVYAVVTSTGGAFQSIQTSPNSGQSWFTFSPLPPNYMASEGYYASAFINNGNTLYVGGSSPDGTAFVYWLNGGAWTNISVDALNNGPHNQIHTMTLAGGDLVVGSDGGVWRYNFGTQRWSNINGNLATQQITGLATDLTNPNRAFAGGQGMGTALFSGDQAWAQVHTAGTLSGSQVAIDPNNPNNVYHVQRGELPGASSLYRSTDGGVNWSVVAGISGNQDMSVVIDARSRVFVSTSSGVRVFNPVNPGAGFVFPGSVFGNKIAVANRQGAFVADASFGNVIDVGANNPDPNTIYVASGTSISVTKNFGASWVSRNIPGLNAATDDITDILVDPNNRDIVYATIGGEVRAGNVGTIWKSTNAGRNWVSISTGLPDDYPAWKLTIDPRNGDLYAGMENGIYKLAPGASTWQRFGNAQTNAAIHLLELNPGTNILTAGSYGRSAWQFFIDTPTVNTGALRAAGGANIWNGPIILAGPTTISAAGNQDLHNGIAIAQLTVGGPITDLTENTTTNTLTKIGGGDVILAAPSIYGGDTIVQEGNLVVRDPDALGLPGKGTTVVAGAILQLESSLNDEPLSLFGNGNLINGHFTGALQNVNGNNTYNGTATLQTNSTIGVDSGSTLTIIDPGTITDPSGAGNQFSLTKEGLGTLTFTTANTYEGDTRVNLGILNVQHPDALGTSGTTTRVLDGAQLQLEAGAGGPFTTTGRFLVLSGVGINSSGALFNVAGDNTWNGDILFDSLPGFSPTTVPPGSVAIGSNPDTTLTIDGRIDDPFSRANSGGVPFGEVEGNNTSGAANGITIPTNDRLIISGSISAGADQDWFQFTLTQRSGVFFDIDSRETGLSATLNSVLTLYATNGTTVLDSNDNGYDFDTGWPAPIVAAAGTADSSLYRDLGPGTYYIRVSSTGGTSGSYQLIVHAETDYSTTVPALNSKPGAAKTIFLDFDGHSATDSWNSGNPYTIAPFDLNGDTAELTPGEKLAIYDIWRVMAEDWAPFDVNISTNYAGAFADGVANRAVFGGDPADVGQGAITLGVAFLDSFAAGGSDVKTFFTFTAHSAFQAATDSSEQLVGDALWIANVASHEAGHTMGLVHYGGGNSQPLGIMQTPSTSIAQALWRNALTHDGEPPVITQDDMAVIAGVLGYRTDDHGNDYTTATILSTANGTNYSSSGIIEQLSDLDYFRFVAAGASTEIRASVLDYVNDLDVKIRLFDSDGTTLLASDDPAGSFDAFLTFATTPGATYYVEVSSNGDAGEAGQYEIEMGPPGTTGAGSGGSGLTFGLTKVGAGTVILAQANGYGGVTSVAEGILRIQNDDALGGAFAGTVVNDGAALELDGDPAGGALNVTEFITLNGFGFNGADGALRNLTGDNTWTGTVTLQTNSSIGADADTSLTVTGNVQDRTPVPIPPASLAPTDLTKVGDGTLVFPNAKTYTGNTFINEGALNIRNPLALGINTSAVQTVNVSGFDGSFVLYFDGGFPGGVNSGPLNFDVTASGLQTAINNMLATPGSPGYVSAAVHGTVVVTVQANGNTFNVVFGGTLANTKDVPLLIAPPSLFAASAKAFTSLILPGGNSRTVVADGASLQLQGGFTEASLKPLVLHGDGFNDAGALVNVSGDNTWNSTPVILGSSASFGSDAGTLFVDQEITDSYQKQTIQFVGFAAGNKYTLTFDGVVTPEIVYQANAIGDRNAIEAALNAMPSINLRGGAASVTSLGSNTFEIALVGNLAGRGWNQTPMIKAIRTFGGGSFVHGTVQNVSYGYDVTKYGPSTVQFTGSTSNDYTGLTTVYEGTLELNKLAGSLAILGDLQVGDGVLSAGAAIAKLLADNQIASSSSVTVNSDGLFDLNNHQQTIVDLLVNEGTTTTGTGAAGGALTAASITINDGALNAPGSNSLITVNGPLDVNGGSVTLAGNTSKLIANGTADFDTATVLLSGDNSELTVNDNPLVATDSAFTLSGDGATLQTINAPATFTDSDVTLSGPNSRLAVGGLTTLYGSVIDLAHATSMFTLGGDLTTTSDATDGASRITGAGALSLGGVNRVFTVNHDSNSTSTRDLWIEAPITGAGVGITKVGAGKLELDADSSASYTGDTIVNTGVVQVDGVIANVRLTGGTLAGTGVVGAITGNSPAEGTINPGDNDVAPFVGTLTSGDATWGPDTTFFIHLTVTDGGDALIVNGDIDLGGATLIGHAIPGIPIDSVYTIITYTGSRLNANKFFEPYQADTVFISGQKFTVLYDDANKQIQLKRVQNVLTSLVITSAANPSIYGDDVTITATGIPEPGGDFSAASPEVTFYVYNDAAKTDLAGTFTTTMDTGTGLASFAPQSQFSTVWGGDTHHYISVSFTDQNGFYANFDGSPDPFDQQVDRQDVDVSVTSDPVISATVPVYGQTIDINAAVAPTSATMLSGSQNPTGTATFILNPGPSQVVFSNVPLVSGTATLTLPNLPTLLDAGANILRISYDGDGNYLPSGTQDFVVIVKADSTSIAVTPPSGPTRLGQPADFSILVTPGLNGSPGAPQGEVRIYDNNTSNLLATISYPGVPGPEISFNTSTLTVGVHDIIVKFFSSNGNYADSTVTIQHTIERATTAVSFQTPIPTSSIYGESVAFVVKVEPNPPIAPSFPLPTGTIRLRDGVGGAIIGSGSVDQSTGLATINVGGAALNRGTHNIVAEYTGNASFDVSTTTYNGFVVNPASTQVVTVTASPSAGSFFGQLVTLTATVTTPNFSAPTLNSTVTFTDDLGTNLAVGFLDSTGKATATTTLLPVGTRTIFAHYTDNVAGNFADSDGQLSTSYVVSPTNTHTSLSASPTGGAVYGQLVTFTAQVTADFGMPPFGANSIVTFRDITTGQVLGSDDLDASRNASITVSLLYVGSHNIRADYVDGADANFNPSSSSLLSYTLGKANSSTALTANPVSGAVFGQDVILTATVSSSTPGALPIGVGSTVVFIDMTTGQNLGQANLNAGFQAAITTDALTAATHTIRATYTDNTSPGFFNSSFDEVTNYTVGAAGTTISTFTSSGTPTTVVGQVVTLTATVETNNPSHAIVDAGSVTFIDTLTGATLGSANVNAAGTATFNTSFAIAGIHTLTAKYNGSNPKFLASDVVFLDQTVQKISTVSVAPIVGAAFSQTLNFVVTVSGSPGTPTGVINVHDNTTGADYGPFTLDGAGKTTAVLAGLTAGPHSLTFNYGGDSTPTPGFFPSSRTIAQVVNQAATTTTLLAPAPSPSTYGDMVTLTAYVGSSTAPAPTTGSVTFKTIFAGVTTNLATVPLNGNTFATYDTLATQLPAGAHKIFAVYNGDAANYAASAKSANRNHTVAKASTAVDLQTSVPTGTYFGNPVTFTATVTATTGGAPGTPATGTVTFKLGALILKTVAVNALGVAEFTTLPKQLPVGNLTITARYNGNPNFAPSVNASVTQDVVKAETNVMLATSHSPSSIYGQVVTFTATVAAVDNGGTPGVPNGTVTFKDGAAFLATVTLVNGTAVYKTGQLSAASHNITATYNGTAKFDTDADAVTQVVEQATTTVTFTSTPAMWAVGKPATFNAVVTSNTGKVPTGTVTFTIDGPSFHQVLGPVTLGAGRASSPSFTFPSVPDDYTVTVDYTSLTTNFTDATTSRTQTVLNVTKATLTSLSAENGVTLTVKISSTPTAGVPTGVVDFYEIVNGLAVLLGQGTLNANGKASLFVDLPSGQHKIYAYYGGDGALFNPASVKGTAFGRITGRLV
ncbi:MAG: Ig-like domain repeat protein [Planctomycetes bacterium]|nr:Ig-like domain repeat protein [Planctomycetota bacterium]